MQCPFCLQEKQRILGGIFLSAPREWEKMEATAGDRACNTCLTLIAQLLDAWRGGGINSFIQKAQGAGILEERVEYVESGFRRTP
jgi:hypothetical protein